ncbi:hypothetical protein RF11_11887 [Thelohanellus kitauei]|uniref:Uncharacterized protein n=1 Tax=Thelohanellus kitauei TaxID=669202 RepID=A0A0C2J1Y5_THEKT|nr:hypothetical protein RF11_11887 [Thelohanellus kitauei]
MRHQLTELSPHRILIHLYNKAMQTARIEFLINTQVVRSIVTRININVYDYGIRGHYMASGLNTRVEIPCQRHIEIMNKEFVFPSPQNFEDYLVLNVKNFSLTSKKTWEVVEPVSEPVLINFKNGTENPEKKLKDNLYGQDITLGL